MSEPCHPMVMSKVEAHTHRLLKESDEELKVINANLEAANISRHQLSADDRSAATAAVNQRVQTRAELEDLLKKLKANPPVDLTEDPVAENVHRSARLWHETYEGSRPVAAPTQPGDRQVQAELFRATVNWNGGATRGKDDIEVGPHDEVLP